jgi:hypothetical protein
MPTMQMQTSAIPRDFPERYVSFKHVTLLMFRSRRTIRGIRAIGETRVIRATETRGIHVTRVTRVTQKTREARVIRRTREIRAIAETRVNHAAGTLVTLATEIAETPAIVGIIESETVEITKIVAITERKKTAERSAPTTITTAKQSEGIENKLRPEKAKAMK